MKCEFGVVKKIWINENKVVLIHSPDFWETAYNLQLQLQQEGFDVVRLNTGVEEDRVEAERLFDQCFE
jgi:predicted CoA-binding protein